jgi:hypothetical protein
VGAFLEKWMDYKRNSFKENLTLEKTQINIALPPLN